MSHEHKVYHVMKSITISIMLISIIVYSIAYLLPIGIEHTDLHNSIA
jgi:hypothetical protein